MKNYTIILTLISTFLFAEHSPNEVSLNSKLSTVKKVNNFYILRTNEKLRDNLPQQRKIEIDKSYPYIESNSNMFNALFSMAIEEMKENMVSTIYDSSFGQDRCDCFETGKKWNYVWTRDIAYSVHLALADLAPKRSMNSLLFKVSNFRGKGSSSSQIVQDTGTGGSWPISTDRVTWSLGALKLLNYLSSSDKRKFATIAYKALKNTVEADRRIVYDNESGLYTGEQSFLDWREQTYPSWVKNNIIHIGMSKSLSTNIAHYIALLTLETLGNESGKSTSKYRRWAKSLKKNINNSFWDNRRKLFSLMLTTYLGQNKVDKFDLLGNSLAVLFDIAQSNSQKSLLKNYKMTDVGAPVIFPQDIEAPIYHNRAIWPFVSSYALLASKKESQSQIFDHLFTSIINGAALNLSNMENFEFTTLDNNYFDGNKSGPVLNSQRQLWSVAGFLSTYLEGIFGKEVKNGSIRFSPFITSRIRNTLLSNTNSITLKNYKWRGKFLNVTVQLPKQDKRDVKSFYLASKILLNNKMVHVQDFISFKDLKETNKLVIDLHVKKESYDKPKISNSNFFSLPTPKIIEIEEKENNIKLKLAGARSYNIYQDKQLIKRSHSSSKLVLNKPKTTSCFTVEAEGSNKSFHSEPQCYWPKGSIQTLSINKRSRFINKNFYIPKSGKYLLQAVFENPGNLTTGITSSVKRLTIFKDKSKIHTGYLFLPHTSKVSDSNFIKLDLESNGNFKIEIEDEFNMSYFDHFRTYVHRGGRSGKDNSAYIYEFKLLKIN